MEQALFRSGVAENSQGLGASALPGEGGMPPRKNCKITVGRVTPVLHQKLPFLPMIHLFLTSIGF